MSVSRLRTTFADGNALALLALGAMLLLSPVAQEGGLHAQTAATSAASSATATFSGTVLTDATERPLMNAEITLSKVELKARSDSAGNFTITGIPAGEYPVAIRLVGFETIFTTLTFAAGQKLEADFLLKDRIIQFAPKAELQRTGTDPNIAKQTFDERRQTGMGKYVGADGYIGSSDAPTAEIIKSRIPALHSNAIGKREQAMASATPRVNDSTFTRGDASDIRAGAKADCHVQVLLNGTVVYRAESNRKLFDVNSIPSRMLLTMEYYAANDTPVRYSGVGSQCGTLVIWTRGR